MSKAIMANANTSACSLLEARVPAVDTVTQERWPPCSALASPMPRATFLGLNTGSAHGTENNQMRLTRVLLID